MFGIIVVIILILAWTFAYSREISDLLNGFWIASSDFLKRASLDKFVLYVDGSAGYIIIADAEDILLDQSIKLSFSQSVFSMSNWIPGSGIRYFTFSSDVDGSVIPKHLNAQLHVRESKLVLTTPTEIIAILFKDAELTAIAKARREKIPDLIHESDPPKDSDKLTTTPPESTQTEVL